VHSLHLLVRGQSDVASKGCFVINDGHLNAVIDSAYFCSHILNFFQRDKVLGNSKPEKYNICSLSLQVELPLLAAEACLVLDT